MRQIFELSPEQIKVRNILTNKKFIEIEIYSISNAKPNRNHSHFTLDSMKKGVETYVDTPIVGFFGKDEDFEGHEARISYDPELKTDYWDNEGGEQILGFTRAEDQREIVEKDGLSWIRSTAMICTQYNFKQVKKLLKDKSKKVSVEIEVLESEVVDGIEHIHSFDLLGITILGSKKGVPVAEGIAGARLSVLDILEQQIFSEQKRALAFAYEELKINKKEDENLAKDKNKEGVGIQEGIEDNALDNIATPDGSVTAIEEAPLATGDKGTFEDPTVQDKEPDAPIDPQSKEGEDGEEGAVEGEPIAGEGTEPAVATEGEENAPVAVSVEQYEEIQAKCAELEKQCSNYEAQISDFEKKHSEYENTIAEQKKAIEEHTKNFEKIKDFEILKAELEEATKELATFRVGEQKNFILNTIEKRGLSVEEVKEISDKCERQEYQDIESIERDIAYILFKKEETASVKDADRFAVNLAENSGENGNISRASSVEERLRQNIKK